MRNPTLSTAPYLARGEIHQIFGLTDKIVDQDRDPFSLASQVPERRFEVRVGKMGLPDVFDVNSVGSDSHLQFTNWTIDNNGAWDYAAERAVTPWLACWSTTTASGRRVTPSLPCQPSPMALRSTGPSAAPRAELGVRTAQGARRAISQFEARGRRAHSKLREPRAHGDYRESVQQYLAGKIPTPDITKTEVLAR